LSHTRRTRLPRAGLLFAVGLLAALAVAANPEFGILRTEPTAAKRDCSQLFGSFSVGEWPPACWRPYGSNSPFNVPISPRPRISPESNAIVAYFVSHHWAFNPDRRGRFTIEDGGSRPVYWSRSSDQLVSVTCEGGHTCQRGMRVHIPQGARPEAQGDGHMTVIDQAARREYDFWKASTPEHGRMTVSSGNGIPVGAGTGTGLGGVAEAANLGLAGGLIRGPELAAGVINHALAITTECVQRQDVWPSPADGHGDSVCPDHGTGPHFASLLQLDMSNAEIAATHAPRWQRAVMKAMARYGMYVVDTNSPGNPELSVIMEDDLSFTSFGRMGEISSFVRSAGGTDAVVGVPIDVSKLRVIAPCVPRRTC
jgi:hypothetical protein